ncbi:hypothetical protein SH139x_004539 [Planctomycetaceae bacterium SH139]
MTVKDEFAGKAVRCPACKTGIRVPATSAATRTATTGGRTASGAAQPGSTATAATPADLGLGGLFDEEGIAGFAGPACPSCGGQLKPGAVLCTHCGTNLQTGQRLAGHEEAAAQASKYGHRQLDEAVMSMAADDEMQRRTTNVGMPWWFLLIMLVFLGFFSFAAVTIVNAANAGSDATGFAGTIKGYAANKNIVWGCIISGLIVQGIARIWLVIKGFMLSVGDGLVTLFLYHKFLGQLGEHPVIGLVYTLGFFTTLSGLGLAVADWLGK